MRFMAAIHYDGRLQMNEYTVKVYMMTNTEDPDDHNVALNRIKHFVYNELESTIFISADEVEYCSLYAAAGLNITTMPSEPVDQLIGIMLFTKFTAITESRLIIGEVEISSMLGDGVIYLHGENENVSNVIMPDWWASSDVAHSDLTETDKVVTMHKSSVWRELNLSWPELEDDLDDMTPVDESGNTVVFADFKRLDDTK